MYLEVILAPVLLVRPAECGAVEAWGVADLLHLVLADLDALLHGLDAGQAEAVADTIGCMTTKADTKDNG